MFSIERKGNIVNLYQLRSVSSSFHSSDKDANAKNEPLVKLKNGQQSIISAHAFLSLTICNCSSYFMGMRFECFRL